VLQFTFTATVIEWRGPAPFYYAPLPAEEAEEVRGASKLVSYGWGVIPVTARLNGGAEFTTSLFPRDGTYLVPLKDKVRRPSGVTVGDSVEVELTLGPAREPEL
jgi:hypothetical protein